jgi:hypothetical protein
VRLIIPPLLVGLILINQEKIRTVGEIFKVTRRATVKGNSGAWRLSKNQSRGIQACMWLDTSRNACSLAV